MRKKIYLAASVWAILVLFLFQNIKADQIQLTGKIKYVPEIEKALKQGMKSYNAKDYSKSSMIFEKMTKFSPTHQRISISYLMYGKSLIKTGKFQEAILQFRNLMAEYPQTRYAENCHYEIGICFYLMNNPAAAVREFIWLLDYGKSPELIEKSRLISEFLISQNLTIAEIKTILHEIYGPRAMGFLTQTLAEKQVRLGLMNAALNSIIDFLNANPGNDYEGDLESYLTKIKLRAKSDLKIGVILPVTSGYTDDGVGILRGISFALKEYHEKSNQKIDLVIRNSGSNVVSAIKAAQAMMQDDNIIAIIGELESDITAAIGATLNSGDLPLIAPVASQNGLASINKNVFQANSDLYQRGKQMASYAIDELGLNTFATIAPADDYGQEMIEGFTTTVEKLGGSIVAPPKWYFQGSTNLGRQLRNIRNAGFNIMKEDTTWVRENMTLLASAVTDTFIVPITSIDALFCPVYTDEVKYLGPQCANINLRTRFLGGDYWFDLETLRAGQTYIDSVVFVSDYYINEYDPDFRRLRSKFRVKMGHDLNRMEAFGYDTMKAILQTIEDYGITNRQILKEKLQLISHFSGVKGTVTWRGNQRVNKDVNVLEFRNGMIRKLK